MFTKRATLANGPDVGRHVALIDSMTPSEWNAWRRSWSGPVDLKHANLAGRNLSNTDLADVDLACSDLSDCIFHATDLCRANLFDADLSGSELVRCDLSEARMPNVSAVDSVIQESWLFGTDLTDATLSRSKFFGSHLSHVSLINADFTDCDLSRCLFNGADISGAHFVRCSVYGMAAWDISGKPAESIDLRITDNRSNAVTVDDLRIAQFIHLLIDDHAIRSVIEEISAKVVLLLGRFTKERKDALDGLRRVLRTKNLIPVMFDFDRPLTRSYRETVMLLAHLARVIIVDLTDALEVRSELAYIAPDMPSTPIIPIIRAGHDVYVTFDDLRVYPWVSVPIEYSNSRELEALVVRAIESSSVDLGE